MDVTTTVVPSSAEGAGTGLSAKCEERAGIDLIVIYNSGRYRMAERGSPSGLMAYGNANDVVIEMAAEVLPVVTDTPVLAGVNGTDPFFDPEVFLRELARLGFSGVQNFPTVGLIDGTFRMHLEETGMSYSLEVDMIRCAHEMDLSRPCTYSRRRTPWTWSRPGPMSSSVTGLTQGGSIGAETGRTLDESVELMTSWSKAARAVPPDVIVLCHSGPIAEPGNAQYVFDNAAGVHGFYGASFSMEPRRWSVCRSRRQSSTGSGSSASCV